MTDHLKRTALATSDIRLEIGSKRGRKISAKVVPCDLNKSVVLGTSHARGK